MSPTTPAAWPPQALASLALKVCDERHRLAVEPDVEDADERLKRVTCYLVAANEMLQAALATARGEKEPVSLYAGSRR